MPSTSPVDFISGPKVASTRLSFAQEKTGHLMPTCGLFGQSPGVMPCWRRLRPRATCVAMAASGTPATFMR